jgi:hypothetical protein
MLPRIAQKEKYRAEDNTINIVFLDGTLFT